MKVEEVVRLALDIIWRAEEEEHQHDHLKDEHDACTVKEVRLKYDEDDLWLNAKDKARLFEEANLPGNT